MSSTLDDIARVTGLSRATVARVVGGYGRTSEKTKKKVMEAAKRLHYKPNSIARSMVTGKTKNIGLVVGDIQNPFFATIARSITDVIVPEGYSLIVASTDESLDVEKSSIDRFFQKQVDGLIVAPVSANDNDHLRECVDAAIPLVIIDRIAENLEVDTVASQDEEGGFEATEYLINLGHRNIGFLSDTLDISTNWDRLKGYRDALSAHKITDSSSRIRMGGFAIDDAYKSAVALLSHNRNMTAVVTTNNYMAAGLLLAAKDMDIPIPDRLSIVSFDDIVWFELTKPPITAMAQNTREIGVVAARRLLTSMATKRKTNETIRLKMKLIVRDSCLSLK